MIGFITCGKSKRPERCKAKDLYNSPLSKNKQLYLKVLYPNIDIYIYCQQGTVFYTWKM